MICLAAAGVVGWVRGVRPFALTPEPAGHARGDVTDPLRVLVRARSNRRVGHAPLVSDA